MRVYYYSRRWLCVRVLGRQIIMGAQFAADPLEEWPQRNEMPEMPERAENAGTGRTGCHCPRAIVGIIIISRLGHRVTMW